MYVIHREMAGTPFSFEKGVLDLYRGNHGGGNMVATVHLACCPFSGSQPGKRAGFACLGLLSENNRRDLYRWVRCSIGSALSKCWSSHNLRGFNPLLYSIYGDQIP